MEKVVEMEIKGVIKYIPAYVINGVDHLVSHQDKLMVFDTKKDAEEYFED